MFCPKCGKEMKASSQYCPFCGNEIGGSEKEDSKKSASAKRIPYVFLMLVLLVLGISLGIGSYYLLRNQMDSDRGDQINVNEIVEGDGISRYEWMKMLCENYSVKEYQETTPYFSDVTADSPYFTYVQAAVEQGILQPEEYFNGDASVTGKYAAVTVCRAIGESAFVIYTGDEAAWTNDKYVEESVKLGILDAEQINRNLNETECTDLIGKALYVENTELWLDNYTDIEYKKGTYEVDDSVIESLAEDCNEIRLTEGKYKKGNSLVFRNQQGFWVIKTITAVQDGAYFLEDADLDSVLEKYYVSDVQDITLQDICSTGNWTMEDTNMLNTTYSSKNDLQMFPMEVWDKSGEQELYGTDNSFTITLSGDDDGDLEIKLEEKGGKTFTNTLEGYPVGSDTEVSIEIQNLKVKYRYDYWRANNKILIECDSTITSKMTVEEDLVNIPIWEPVPNISFGDDTVNFSMGLYFNVNASGEVYFSFQMPVSAGVENIGTIVKPVIQIKDINSPIAMAEGELFGGLKFEIKASIFGQDGLEAGLGAGAKVTGSRTIRDLDGVNNILCCDDLKVTAPYFKVYCNIKGFDDLKYEEGLEIPYGLHVELYSSGTPKVAAVKECTYRKVEHIIDEVQISRIALALGECISEGSYDNNFRYTGLKYDPQDDDFVVSAVYYFSALFSDHLLDAENEHEEDGLYVYSVEREKVEEYLATLFEGKDKLPLREGNVDISYDRASDEYRFAVGDAGAYYAQIDSTEWKKNELEVEVSLYAGEDFDAELDLQMKLVLVNNSNKAAYDRGMIYSVRDCEVTYRREIQRRTYTQEEIAGYLNQITGTYG